MQTKTIEGTWWDFQHQNMPEGKYFNTALARFDDGDWRCIVHEAAAIGMRHFVIMSVAIDFKAFYDTPLLPKYGIRCEDPIEAVLSAADECSAMFYLSNDYFDDAWDGNRDINSPDTFRKRARAMEEIVAKYGHHPSFHGWYWPVELWLGHGIPDYYHAYLRQCGGLARQLTPRAKTMIAPYGTGVVAADDNYVRDLEKADVDIVAYQDEIGCERHSLDHLPGMYERIRAAHDRAGRVEMWADVEIFTFEGELQRSALLPAPFGRVRAQLEAASPFVDKILVYEYQGMMSKPGSLVAAGHPDSTTLHADYTAWLGTRGES